MSTKIMVGIFIVVCIVSMLASIVLIQEIQINSYTMRAMRIPFIFEGIF